MNKCTDCINENICKGNLRKGSHEHCFQPKVKDYPTYLDNPKPTRKQTNYDRIRNMNIEEMAQLFVYCNDFHSFDTNNGTYDRFDEALKAEIEWLMKEVSRNDGQ